MSAPYTPPTFSLPAFNCPFCGAFAKQTWTYASKATGRNFEGYVINDKLTMSISQCDRCEHHAIWHKEGLIYPFGGAAPLPNPDMPEDVKQDYEEARSVLSISPRGAAALLRLAVQKLCVHLGESGDNINTDIASLVKKGLPVRLQQALDSVRVVGNNAVHPGQIDLTDNVELATKLFTFLNIIVTNRITEDKMISEYFTATVPSNLQDAIAKRDAPRPATGS